MNRSNQGRFIDELWGLVRKCLPYAKGHHRQRLERQQRKLLPPPARPAWYETENGRERLGREIRLIRSMRLEPSTYLTSDGRLGLLFRRTRGRSVDVLCSHGFPVTPPRMFMRAGSDDAAREVENIPWKQGSHIIHILAPLLGPESDADQ